jgi:hypothetical protein
MPGFLVERFRQAIEQQGDLTVCRTNWLSHEPTIYYPLKWPDGCRLDCAGDPSSG